MQSMELSNTSKSSKVLEDKLFRSSTGERIILLFAEDVLESSLDPDIMDSPDTLLEGGVGRDGGTVGRTVGLEEREGWGGGGLMPV